MSLAEAFGLIVDLKPKGGRKAYGLVFEATVTNLEGCFELLFL